MWWLISEKKLIPLIRGNFLKMKLNNLRHWDGSSGMFFRWERQYSKSSNFMGKIACRYFGYFTERWTPIVIVTKRYPTWFGYFKQDNK